MANLELNVVSIVIGVLLARIVFIWVIAFKNFVESMESYDKDIQESDRGIAIKKLVSALVSTGISGFIIIIIIIIYS